MAEVTKFAKFDQLEPQGQTTDFPGTYDTLLGDAGGWRSTLYDHNLYFKVVSLDSYTDNLLAGNTSRVPQQYNGQKLSLGTNNFFRLSWKIAGSGKDITQLNFALEQNSVSWSQLGPSGVETLRLDLYSSFFNRRVELLAGYGSNIVNFIGLFAGGNPILANGLAATIPIETGLSTGSTPLVNLQLNGDHGWYSKSGVQRSLQPEGLVYDFEHNNIGLDFNRPGANPLYIEELGVLRPASPDGRQIWLRVGGLYNTTRYARFDGDGTSRNWSAYALADYQVYKPSKALPYRGIFAGLSALFAPGNVNVYTRTYEGRVYAIGMVPGRPTDSGTITLDYNQFSRDAHDAYDALGANTQPYQFSASVLYAIHVTRGIYLAPSLTYLLHPAFAADARPAFNLGFSLTIQL